jgi:hypothetical protein
MLIITHAAFPELWGCSGQTHHVLLDHSTLPPTWKPEGIDLWELYVQLRNLQIQVWKFRPRTAAAAAAATAAGYSIAAACFRLWLSHVCKHLQ